MSGVVFAIPLFYSHGCLASVSSTVIQVLAKVFQDDFSELERVADPARATSELRCEHAGIAARDDLRAVARIICGDTEDCYVFKLYSGSFKAHLAAGDCIVH